MDENVKNTAGRRTLLRPFKLERFFAKYEFTAPYLLCCSDCEPLSMADVLAMADTDALNRWHSLSLGYTETKGLPVLRQEISKLYATLCEDDVVVCAPEEGVYLTMLALLKPGDHVVAMTPGYQSLYEIAHSLGCHVSYWEPSSQEGLGTMQFELSHLKELIKPSTRLVVVNFPHNPTGQLLSESQWRQLMEMCSSVGCYLFSDEMYRLLELDPSTRLPAAVDLYPRAVSLSGTSKALSLPGLRIGWLASRDARLLSDVLQLKDYTTICSSAPSEVLALMAVRAHKQIVERNLSIVRRNIEHLNNFFTEFKHMFEWRPPQASSVVFPRLTTGEPIEAFCDRVVQGCGVLLLPATVYDHPPSTVSVQGHFRVGLGRRNLPECVDRLAQFLRLQSSQTQPS